MKTRVVSGDPYISNFLLHFYTSNPTLRNPDNWNKDEGAAVIADVEVKIDGVSVDPLAFIKSLEESFEHYVKEEAANLYQEKIGAKFHELHNLLHSLEKQTREAAYQHLGVELDEYDW